MSSLARELAPSISHGPVVVVVGSSKDAATAFSLGADEVVRVVHSMSLRKGTIGGAIERARARARWRRAAALDSSPATGADESSGDAFLIRVLERRLGVPLDAATTRCKGLADELKGAVAVADRLMQRVQLGAKPQGLKRWRGDVKDYARATLKAEALAVELEEQVGRTHGVVKALDDLSLKTPTSETDTASALNQFAEFVRDGLPEGATLHVDAPHPCIVGVPRQTVIGMLCNAIESALYNMMEAECARRISLRAWLKDAATVVVEVTDDGAPALALFHASPDDPSFSDSRATWLRHLHKRARRAGGEMTVENHDGINILSLYLPAAQETTAQPQLDGSSGARRQRRRRVGPQDERTLAARNTGRPLEPRNS
jgi:hypothetical protein